MSGVVTLAERRAASGAVRKWPMPDGWTGGLLGDPLLDAAVACVERDGFDAASLEAIAAEAKVSRTTIYRRFRNREALFVSLLVQRAQPLIDWSLDIIRGPGPAGERAETVITRSILEMQRIGWLDLSLQNGMSPASIRLFKAANAIATRETLKPLIEAMTKERAAAAGVTIDELVAWLAEQMLALAAGPVWDEATLRKRVRFFVLSVLAPDQPDETRTDARLTAIEARLAALAGDDRAK